MSRKHDRDDFGEEVHEMPAQRSSGPYLITTTPSLINCRTCGGPVMAATIRGMDTYVDTACLTQMGELVALMAGKRTYGLRAADYFVHRGPEAIRAGFPNAYPVMAEHRCGHPVVAEHINSVWSEVATAIVVHAVGGVIVGQKTAHVPPF
jgi:hypothetical protein